jgi:hypothetical protein
MGLKMGSVSAPIAPSKGYAPAQLVRGWCGRVQGEGVEEQRVHVGHEPAEPINVRKQLDVPPLGHRQHALCNVVPKLSNLLQTDWKCYRRATHRLS